MTMTMSLRIIYYLPTSTSTFKLCITSGTPGLIHSKNRKDIQNLYIYIYIKWSGLGSVNYYNHFAALDFVRDNPGKPIPQETFTHSHPYVIPPSFMIHGILLAQFTCLTIFFHNLSPSFLWSTSWPGTLHFLLNTFLH